MRIPNPHLRPPRGHSLIELVAAMVASSILMVGLASVIMIGGQVAYTPTASIHRVQAAGVLQEMADDLRFATLLVEHSPTAVEFVVAERDDDGAAERIRYEWSGTPGDPLLKSINGTTPIPVLAAVQELALEFQIDTETTTFQTTVESAETVLQSNTNTQGDVERDVTSANHSAQRIIPASFPSIPANAISWSATRVLFYGRSNGLNDSTLLFSLRPAGQPSGSPTSEAVGQISIAESSLGAAINATYTAQFPSPIRNLQFHRTYALVFGTSGQPAARLLVNDSATGGVLQSNDSGSSWQFIPGRQMYYQVYGTYTTPGPTYTATRRFATRIDVLLRTGAAIHSHVDAGVPLVNRPELLSGYWRADFDSDPTDTDVNGDDLADWAAPGGPFNPATLSSGVWSASGALETRPLFDFPTTTVIEARCRNTSVGGNGAVIAASVDRQNGLHAPLLVYLRLQSDGTQTLTLLGKTSDVATRTLHTVSKLPSGFRRIRLTVAPVDDVVNLSVDDEDQGSFIYPTYAPSTTDRYVSISANVSIAEFDYIEVRAAEAE